MNFSPLIQQSGEAKYSPNGKMLAIVKGTAVSIIATATLDNLNKFTGPDQISCIEWSPDSHMLLMQINKRNMLVIKSINDNDWLCKIEEGLSGLIYSYWLPDSIHIATVSEFNVRITIYSLADKSISYINNPKPQEKGHCFSPNKDFMAVLEKHDLQDYIGIYQCCSLACVKHFPIESTSSIGILWSDDGYSIAVWDSIDSHKMVVYNLEEKVILSQTNPKVLGIKSICPSPCGTMVAVSSFNEKVIIYSMSTWSVIGELEHSANINTDIEAYREITDNSPSKIFKCKYTVAETPIKFKRMPLISDKVLPQSGVSMLKWSYDSQYLATVDDSIPNVVWIWDMKSLTAKVLLIQMNTVKCCSWNACKQQLAIGTGELKIYLWSNDGASICDIPYDNKDFVPVDMKWSLAGDSLVVSDKVSL